MVQFASGLMLLEEVEVRRAWELKYTYFRRMAKITWTEQGADYWRGELFPHTHFVIIKDSKGYLLQVPEIKNYIGNYRRRSLDQCKRLAEYFSKDETREISIREIRLRTLRGSVTGKKK